MTNPAIELDHGNLRLAIRYDRAASGWARRIARLGYAAAYATLAARGLERIAPQQSDRPIMVLDAGCGAGDFARAVAGAATTRIAVDLVDLSPAMLAVAETELAAVAARTRAIIAAVEDAPLAAGGYDVALCAHLIEHVAQPHKVLDRLRDALKPGGVLMLVVNRPHWCTRLIQLRWRTRAFDPAQVDQLLKDSGFKIVERVCFRSGPPSRTSMGYLASL
jgi:2-polyprenyl-3-methyl-5-hydroxy-6-metoxy-1,4-benzoquinol methylase